MVKAVFQKTGFFLNALNQISLIFLLHSLFGKDPPAQKERANMITVVIIQRGCYVSRNITGNSIKKKKVLVVSITNNE